VRVVVAAVSTVGVGVAGVDESHLTGCSQGVSNWMSPWDNLPSRTGHDESVAAAAGDGDARKHLSTRMMVAEPVLLIWRMQNLKL
jgi:hypothetical protein